MSTDMGRGPSSHSNDKDREGQWERLAAAFEAEVERLRQQQTTRARILARIEARMRERSTQ